MRRRAAKVDDNQREIVDALRKRGCFVQSLAPIGTGCSDLLVGRNGKWLLMEVKDGSKTPSQRQLTPQQVQFILDCRNRGPIHVVETVEQALEVIQ